MNNCPKCGNPLQEGTSTCPICGTNIVETKTAEVASVAQPVAQAPQAPAPVAEPAPAPAPEAQPAPAQPAPAPAAPVEAASQASAAPAPVAQPAPAAVEPTAIAPTVERVESNSPIPGIPSSVANPTVGLNEENKPLVDNPKLHPKKKKTPLIIALVALVVMGAVTFVTLQPGSKKKTNKANTQEAIAMSSLSTSGYRMKIAEGWQVDESGESVIVTNSDSTVAMKLEHSNSNLANIDKVVIEQVMAEKEEYKDVVVSETNISGRDAYVVNTLVNDYPVQMYFINGGTDLMIGATIVYQSTDSKAKYESAITEMIGTLSYSNDSTKALDTINQYENMFRIYRNIAGRIPKNQTNIEDYNRPTEEPVEEPVDEGGQENPEVEENPEQPTDPEQPSEE